MTDYPADPFSNPPPEFDDLFRRDCDTPLNELLRRPKASQTVNGLAMRLLDRCGEGVQADLVPIEERVVLLVFRSKDYIDNGGFEQLFFYGLPGDPYFSLTIDAYERIGNQEAAVAIRTALLLVPRSLQSPQLAEYYVQHIAYETRRKLADAFYESDRGQERSRVNRLLVEYIRANRKAYEHLDDAQGNA